MTTPRIAVVVRRLDLNVERNDVLQANGEVDILYYFKAVMNCSVLV